MSQVDYECNAETLLWKGKEDLSPLVPFSQRVVPVDTMHSEYGYPA